MARTRSENYDGIHLGILTNAARLFSAQGYMRASIADLADACKLSPDAVRSRIHRARLELRDYLQQPISAARARPLRAGLTLDRRTHHA